MRLRRSLVPMYSVHGNLLRQIPRSEAVALVETKQATEYTTGAGKLRSMVAIKLRVLVREERNSPCCITYGEMQANAGLHDSAGYMRAARCKIAEWRDVPLLNARHQAWARLPGRKARWILAVLHPRHRA